HVGWRAKQRGAIKELRVRSVWPPHKANADRGKHASHNELAPLACRGAPRPHGERFRPKSRQIQANRPVCHCGRAVLGARESLENPMPDAIQLLKARRSIKPSQLAGPPPSAEEIETLLTIASRVPDHGKLVPWRFIVFEGEARLAAGEAITEAFRAKYPDANPEQLATEQRRLARAPLVIAVVSRAAPHAKIPEWEQVLSAGAAAMSLVFAAHALGYAANWITEWYAYDRAVLDALGLAPHEKIAGFIHIGRHGETAEDRPRPALAEIVTRYGR